MLRSTLMISASLFGLSWASAAHAVETSIFSQADLGFSKVEGRDFRTAGVRTGALVELLPHLKTGLSVGAIAGTQKASLFDDFLGYDVSLELGTSFQMGAWQPFVSVRTPLHSDFGATGSINDYPTNTTTHSNPGFFTIERPDGTPGFYGRSGNLSRDFKLKGSIQGADVSMGSGYALTEKFSLTLAAGYSARTLRIRTAELEGSPWKDVRWGFEERHGLTTRETDDGNMIEPNRKSRFLGGTTLSFGMNYSL